MSEPTSLRLRDRWFFDDLLGASSAAGGITDQNHDSTAKVKLYGHQKTTKTKPYGDVIQIFNMNGRAKPGIKWFFKGKPATIQCANAAPYALTNGMTLTVKIDGGATQTVTFNTANFVSIGAATAKEVAVRICAVATGMQASEAIVGETEKVDIASDTFGTSSTVEVTGGTANAVLGFSTTAVAGTSEDYEVGWIVAHSAPNNEASDVVHRHMSFESPDSNGEAQTRFEIPYGYDQAPLRFNSSDVIVHSGDILLTADPNSNRELIFGLRPTRQNKERRIVLWCDADDGTVNGSRLRISTYDQAGNGATRLCLERANGRWVFNNGTTVVNNSQITVNGDITWATNAKGPVLVDRATATYRRILCTNGTLSTEAA